MARCSTAGRLNTSATASRIVTMPAAMPKCADSLCYPLAG
jgi:hypothetical protein